MSRESSGPRVSIVTVCFNSERTIRDTIESVLGQTYPWIEHIVVDGASTDSTLKIIGEYEGRIAQVISEPDEGIYDAMNKGVAAATGDVVGILNSDDFYASRDIISEVAEAFVSNPDADMVFGDVVFVDPEQRDKVVRYYSSGHFRSWKLRFGWMPPHPATFVRKQLYDRSGGYRKDFSIAADYEMFVRWLFKLRARFVRINQVLVTMRAGGVSTAGPKSSWLLNREIVRACRENGIYTNLVLVLSKIPFKLLELVRRPG